MITKCQFCQKEFQAFPQRIRIGKAKFCSKHCQYHSKRSKTVVNCLNCQKCFVVKPSTKNKGGGKYCSIACSSIHREHPNGENHPAWVGDKIGYYGIHDWIKKVCGRPSKCEHCGTETAKKFEWANISGEYKRDVSDWKRFCTKCHIAFDKSSVKGEDHGQVKLTNDKVIEIRQKRQSLGITMERLAIEYNVSLATIYNIIHKKSWKHI